MGITDAVDMKSRRGCKFGIRISNFEKRKVVLGCEGSLGEGGPAPHKATQGLKGAGGMWPCFAQGYAGFKGGRWKAEGGRRKTEDGRWKTEDGRQRAEGGFRAWA